MLPDLSILRFLPPGWPCSWSSVRGSLVVDASLAFIFSVFAAPPSSGAQLAIGHCSLLVRARIKGAVVEGIVDPPVATLVEAPRPLSSIMQGAERKEVHHHGGPVSGANTEATCLHRLLCNSTL